MVNSARDGIQDVSSNAGSKSTGDQRGVMGEKSPAPNTTIADGVPESESSVLLALRTKDWLSPEDLMARAAVAEDTARACCERFWQMGLVVRRGTYPGYCYRALRVPLHDAGRAYLRQYSTV